MPNDYDVDDDDDDDVYDDDDDADNDDIDDANDADDDENQVVRAGGLVARILVIGEDKVDTQSSMSHLIIITSSTNIILTMLIVANNSPQNQELITNSRIYHLKLLHPSKST